MKEWIGSTPVCSFCKEVEPPRFTAGKTIHGPWAIMCDRCYAFYGIGVGLGKGQVYELQLSSKWKKVAG